MQETNVRSPGWEDPLEKQVATHFSILAWGAPWPAEPGRLQSTGSQRVRHDLATEQQQHAPHQSCLFLQTVVGQTVTTCWEALAWGCWGERETPQHLYFVDLFFGELPLDGNRAPRTRMLLGFARIGTY